MQVVSFRTAKLPGDPVGMAVNRLATKLLFQRVPKTVMAPRQVHKGPGRGQSHLISGREMSCNSMKQCNCKALRASVEQLIGQQLASMVRFYRISTPFMHIGAVGHEFRCNCPPMISFLSSSLCEDAKVRSAFSGRFFRAMSADNIRTWLQSRDRTRASFYWRLIRRQAESASDDLLSVLALNGPDTPYCVRPEALESSPGERFHLRNGSSQNPGN
jgi:hypothetical protein